MTIPAPRSPAPRRSRPDPSRRLTVGRPTWLVGAVVLAAVASACGGIIGEPGQSSAGDAPDAAVADGPDRDGDGIPDALESDIDGDGKPDPIPTAQFDLTGASDFPGLRRLTVGEYAVTVEALTGVAPDLERLPDDLERKNLRNDASWVRIADGNHLRTLLQIATDVAEAADVDAVVPCSGVCSDAELTAFLRQAFARDVTSTMVSRYRDVYERAKAGDDGGDEVFARRAVVQAALVSPYFLYRTELGDGSGELMPWELASKLSYFLVGAPPDATLRRLAADGTLTDGAVYDEQVSRLLDDPRATEQFTDFLFDWLGVDHLDLGARPVSDELPAGIEVAMKQEAVELVRHLVMDEGGSLVELLASDRTWVNESLASVYDLDGVSGDAFQPVSLTGTERRGLLTTAVVLASHGKESGRSPMQRGHFLIDQLTCHSFPSDAGIAAMELPDGDDDATFRERFDPLETQAPCSYCHRVLNAGFAFDVFDPVGRRWPDVASTESRGTFDLPPWEPVSFDGTAEAVEKLAEHPAVASCFVTQLYRRAQGRIPRAADADAVRSLEATLASAPALKDFLGAVARTAAFRRAVDRTDSQTMNGARP